MKQAPFTVVPLNEFHARNDFSCGEESLDRYFHSQVSQDIRRRVTACFVAESKNSTIAGYYTLASTSILITDIGELAKKMPRYPTLPAFRMGRLAVSKSFQGQGLGAALLADAFTRSIRSEIPGFALVVDALNEKAAAFYHHHGFIPFLSAPNSLFLPLETVRKLVNN